MATASFTITVSFDGATQQAANDKRDNAVIDYCKLKGIDYLTAGSPDQTKAVTGVRTEIINRLKYDVKNYRAEQARISTLQNEDLQ